MSTLTTDEARHASDGDLVRMIDGETGPSDADLAAHVTGCASCGARLELLRRRTEHLRQTLAAATPPLLDAGRLRPPSDQLALARALASRRRKPLWSHAGVRAAAAILVLAGIVAATPARAWILERVSRLRADATRVEGGRRVPPPPTAAPQAPASTVWFTPAEDELVIRFDARPTRGTLELLAGDDPRSSAQVVAGAGGEAFLVLPSELRIRNAAGSVADYRVVVSPRVRRVRVLTGDQPSGGTTIDVTPEMRRVIPLAGAGRGTRG